MDLNLCQTSRSRFSAAHVDTLCGWSWLRFLGLLCIFIACGCNGMQSAKVESGLQFQVSLEPTPPTVGQANVSITLADTRGAPVTGAKVSVEGNMNHAGMKPSFAEIKEVQPGRYAGTLNFTMAGDWFLLITVKTAAGIRAEHKFDVRGVQTK